MEALLARIRAELAPFPGRMDAVWRLLASCTVVIVCSMALQIPMLSLSLIMVFFTAQENTVLTRMSGISLIAGSRRNNGGQTGRGGRKIDAINAERGSRLMAEIRLRGERIGTRVARDELVNDGGRENVRFI